MTKIGVTIVGPRATIGEEEEKCGLRWLDNLKQSVKMSYSIIQYHTISGTYDGGGEKQKNSCPVSSCFPFQR